MPYSLLKHCQIGEIHITFIIPSIESASQLRGYTTGSKKLPGFTIKVHWRIQTDIKSLSTEVEQTADRVI